MTTKNARLSTGVYFSDVQGNEINLQSLSNIPFLEISSDDLSLTPNTYFLNVPLPFGASLAPFVWIYATAISDLKAAIVYSGPAACSIPQGCAMPFYNVTGFWVSSVLGGLLHVAMGA